MATVLALTTTVAAQEASLDIDLGTAHRHLKAAELLADPVARTIDVSADVAYGRTMHYRALPWKALAPATTTGSVQFTALDGFAADIPVSLLDGAGQAWLAVETPEAPWPALPNAKPAGASAGPFYLVWMTPEKAGISPEQWPYQIAKIASAAPLEQRYPQLLPKVPPGSAALRGLRVFAANCATCHQLGGAGDAAIGPDLNKPFSPTEYFQENYLRKLVRNPAAVRNWGQRMMPGFSREVLSDASLGDLLAYLKQMAKQRRK